MPNYRRGRINEEMQKELSVLLREVKDPRVSGALVSITAAEVTPDLKFATVYFSVLAGDPKNVKKGLESAKGFIRREIAQRLNLRQTPEFTFVHDHSIEHGAHIAKLIEGINAPKKEQGDDGQ
ncbi:MAG: 30S ribosome-binding factor RbfA [Clostridia bacterium]|nr:30S ribosome-binding factor RbfA [Clostridia bacterium]